jgi:hypothetical protein
MNDDQADGLNASGYWRDRAEKESREKRQEARIRLRELKEWWDQKEKWEKFTKSYPARFVDLIHKATLAKATVQVEPGVYAFNTQVGDRLVFNLQTPLLPDWEFKELFESLEKEFSTPSEPKAEVLIWPEVESYRMEPEVGP